MWTLFRFKSNDKEMLCGCGAASHVIENRSLAILFEYRKTEP